MANLPACPFSCWQDQANQYTEGFLETIHARNAYIKEGPDGLGIRDAVIEEQGVDMEVILKQHPARWMLWEAPPLNETTESLLKMGVKPVVFYTLSNRPLNGNFISIMKENVKRLKAINH